MRKFIAKYIYACKRTFFKNVLHKGIVHLYTGGQFNLGTSVSYENAVITVGNGAKLTIGDHAIINGDIRLGTNAELVIDAGVIIDGITLEVKDNATVKIGKNCSFKNFTNKLMVIGESSTMVIGDDGCFENLRWYVEHANITIGRNCTYVCPEKYFGAVVMYSGNVHIGDYVFIQALIATRFNGQLFIDDYAGIGYNTEIRAEESVTIKKYALISYHVSIFDTNTHTVDVEERRRLKHKYHPQRMGMADESKPDTKAVVIGEDVWLGKSVCVSKGAVLGNKCIVGMHAIVPSGEYPEGTVIVSPKPRIIS